MDYGRPNKNTSKNKKAQGSSSSTRSKRSSSKLITIELVTFAFLAIYMAGYTISSIKKPKVMVEPISLGQIDTPQTYDGIITRDETVVVANESGKAFFNYNENEYVKKDSVVCVIKDVASAAALEKEIAAIDDNILNQQTVRNDASVESEEVRRINSRMQTTVNKAIPTFLSNDSRELYRFKYRLQKEIDARNTILLSDSAVALGDLSDQKTAYEKILSDSVATYTSGAGGLLSYSIDGLEQVFTPKNILEHTPGQIVAETGEIGKVVGEKQVSEGEPMFKVINSNIWYISAFLNNEALIDWEEGTTRTLFLKDGDTTKKILMRVDKMIDSGLQTYIVFSSSKYMADFVDCRNIKFCLDDDTYNGLKVPKTAIVEKTTLKVPSDFISEYWGSNGVYTKEGNSYTFNPVSVLSGKDGTTNILQNFNSVKLGTVVYGHSPDGQVSDAKTFTIADIETAKGLYVANSGTAEFKQIYILTSNDHYSILENNTKYGVKAYDNIVTDASAVTDNQIIR